MTHLHDAHCYQALSARDARFDGLFFVGVTSTGIYCRPVCTARTPRVENCRFFASAAAAERRGFRPCLRCRPELAPHQANGAGTETVRVSHAPSGISSGLSSVGPSDIANVDIVRRRARVAGLRIASGALDAGSLDDLSTELGTSARHLRRIVEQEFGASPVALAQTRRLLTAKQLLSDTTLPMAQVALASGFGSLRRFNALFQSRYRLAPSALRRTITNSSANARARAERGHDPRVVRDAEFIPLFLGLRPPFDWASLVGFLAGRAIPGVERVDGAPGSSACYTRIIRLHGHVGVVQVSAPTPSDSRRLTVHVSLSLLPVLVPLLARLRHLFDLDASPTVIAEHLGADPMLAAVVATSPGRRVPGCVDAFELAVRAVLGQQVSVRGATTLAGRLVAAVATPLPTALREIAAGLHAPNEDAFNRPSLTHEPIAAHRLADAPLSLITGIGLPRARAQCLITMARTVADGGLAVLANPDLADVSSHSATRRFEDEFTALPGIGPWTAHYVAMRALHSPDAFPDGDLVLRKAAGGVSASALRARAERWRPWRAYAAMHLWASWASAG